MRTFGYIALLFALAAAPARAADPQPPPYYVIVHPDNPTASLHRDDLTEIFLKRATRWPNDSVIRPADLPAPSRARARFSEEILGRSVGAVKRYWQELVFSGRGVPPPELDGDEDVVEFVRKHPAAIGYVSPNAVLRGVKVIQVE